ncbi:hypothetical protein LUZ60_000493 [Juncus effusus]|nr:hypothetical protein LUZ60_000493 [Juncus effusus]
MKVQISSTEAAVKLKHPYRSAVPTALIAGILLPLLFLRAAFLAIEAGVSICPSISCLGWRFFKEGDASMEFMSEWRRTGEEMNQAMLDSAPDNLDDFISEIRSISSKDQIDLSNFALKIKATLLKMEHRTARAKLHSSYFRHVASSSIPQPLHCLTLKLSEEYSINSLARSSLPDSHHFPHLTNPRYLHVVIFTSNILAAHVAVKSAVESSSEREKLVFHLVTDKRSYFGMHAWFAMNRVYPAVLEVKGLHQFEWSVGAGSSVEETVRLSKTELVLDYLKIHLPQFFPKLEKVILLDDDVIVQRDLAELWKLDLQENVIGAVTDTTHNEENVTASSLCINERFDYYLNFSNEIILSSLRDLHEDKCAWSLGVNIFDLRAWRRSNITEIYQFWLKKNQEHELKLWRRGFLPPALIAFNGFVHPINSSWIISNLDKIQTDSNRLKSKSILHFNGPNKPWLEISSPCLRQIWRAHLNSSVEFLRSCGVI